MNVPAAGADGVVAPMSPFESNMNFRARGLLSVDQSLNTLDYQTSVRGNKSASDKLSFELTVYISNLRSANFPIFSDTTILTLIQLGVDTIVVSCENTVKHHTVLRYDFEWVGFNQAGTMKAYSVDIFIIVECVMGILNRVQHFPSQYARNHHKHGGIPYSVIKQPIRSFRIS